MNILSCLLLYSRQERNVFEAAANGSAIAGRTVMTVVVNYISFMSILYFVDATLGWLGGRVGYTDLDFEVRNFLKATGEPHPRGSMLSCYRTTCILGHILLPVFCPCNVTYNHISMLPYCLPNMTNVE